MLQAKMGAAIAVAGLTALAASASATAAHEALKLGLIQSMTGAFNTTGKAAVNGALLYLKQHGDTVAGRKIQLVIKDDATAPDAAKRLAQELIVNEKIAILGAGITPSALTVAPTLATRARSRPSSWYRARPSPWALALYGAHQLHPGAVVGDHR